MLPFIYITYIMRQKDHGHEEDYFVDVIYPHCWQKLLYVSRSLILHTSHYCHKLKTGNKSFFTWYKYAASQTILLEHSSRPRLQICKICIPRYARDCNYRVVPHSRSCRRRYMMGVDTRATSDVRDQENWEVADARGYCLGGSIRVHLQPQLWINTRHIRMKITQFGMHS